MTAALIAAGWTAAAVLVALAVGATIALRDQRDCCPHPVDVPEAGSTFAGSGASGAAS